MHLHEHNGYESYTGLNKEELHSKLLLDDWIEFSIVKILKSRL